MNKSVVVIGPFIGDLDQELFAFRPYSRYITSTVDTKQVFISSHYNRSFLYDWIPKENFIPVFESLSREETKQHGYLHEDVSRSDYSQIIKYLKTKVKEKMVKCDIEMYSPPYIKSINTISLHQKEFSPIHIPEMDINRSDHIALIVDKSKESEEIYNILKDLYDIIVLGNMSNGLSQKNIVLKDTNYFVDGYVSMMNYINSSKLVATNCPMWAMVANILNKHLFFWGDACSQFKPNGIFGFGNDNALSVNIQQKGIIDMIIYKYEEIVSA